MRERIYTIPLTDVVVPGGGCPFCRLCAKAEEAMLQTYLDGMLIDIEWRGRILREWLCERHLWGMQRRARKLGGAIVTQALLGQALADLEAGRMPLWGTTCTACGDLQRTLAHHAEAFIHTWLNEGDFRALAAAADPFCLPHLSLLNREAGRLPRRKREQMRTELARMEAEALKPLLGKVDWFVRKHDARFQDAPWNGAEDAVERAIAVLAGSSARIREGSENDLYLANAQRQKEKR